MPLKRERSRNGYFPDSDTGVKDPVPAPWAGKTPTQGGPSPTQPAQCLTARLKPELQANKQKENKQRENKKWRSIERLGAPSICK